jgi:hypothetical protein
MFKCGRLSQDNDISGGCFGNENLKQNPRDDETFNMVR